MVTAPRWLVLSLAPLVWLVAIPLAHGVLPWALSLLAPRYGWADGHPEVWNYLGLAPVAVGAAVLVWVTILGFRQSAALPERIVLDWSPKLLLTQGPYAFTRHPIYLAELTLWLGWALLYGSAVVFVSFLILCLVVNVLVRSEERALEAKFGDVYREYKARVPRWLNTSRRRAEA